MRWRPGASAVTEINVPDFGHKGIGYTRFWPLLFVKFHMFGEKNQENLQDKKMCEKNMEIVGKNSPIRMTLIRWSQTETEEDRNIKKKQS